MLSSDPSWKQIKIRIQSIILVSREQEKIAGPARFDFLVRKSKELINFQVVCISAESARLKPDLIPSDYIRVPVPLWRAWLRWHGCALTVDSQFTRKYLDGEFFEDNKPALELYPLEILLLGHDRKKSQDGTENTPRSLTSWACAQVSRSMTVDELLALCKTELRLGDGDARLWQVVKENEEGNVLLDDGAQNLHQLYSSLGKTKKVNKMKLLLEVRERGTGVWPEELRASLSGKQITAASTLSSNAQLSGKSFIRLY